MIKIAICDDMLNIAKSLQQILLEHDFQENIQVDAYFNGTELFENAIKKRYDIIFTDIDLGEKSENGMIISNKIKDIYPDVIMIFFTGYSTYMDCLLNCEPFRFINKPIEKKELIGAAEDAIRRINNWKGKYFLFKKKGIDFRVRLKDIIYFESNRPYIKIESLDDEPVRFRGKMDDVEFDTRKMTEEFLRPNKSFLINRNFVRSFSSKEVIMFNGTRITITRKYSKDFFYGIMW